MTPHGQDAGASEEAKEAGANALIEGPKDLSNYGRATYVLAAAHDPSLGDARSVNEAWCRADQAAQIEEWVRQHAPSGTVAGEWFGRFADELARKFGAKP